MLSVKHKIQFNALRCAALLALMLSGIPCFAQSPTLFGWRDTITNSLGQVIPDATVIVLSGTVNGAQAVNTNIQPGTPLATIYADPYGATPINQTTSPITTAAGDGTFQFWAPSGYYVIQAYGPGINGQYVYGIAIGAGGGSSGTVNNGTQGQVGCYLGTGTAISGVGPGTAKQLVLSNGTLCPQFVDLPNVSMIPAANCNAGTSGAGWSSAISNFTSACRAGSNNLGGAMQCVPSSGCSAQFMIELPADWDGTAAPYIKIFFGSGGNTSGTVVWSEATACMPFASTGSQSDDYAFSTPVTLTSKTMAAANRIWSTTGQMTGVTSGNNCIPDAFLIVKVSVSGTAGSNVNAYSAIVTIPRLVTVQAN